jgi:flavin-dependent dehydrogenase
LPILWQDTAAEEEADMPRQFDLVITGGGPAGAIAAWHAARDGRRVALIDPDMPVPRLEGIGPRLHHWLEQVGLYDGAAMEAVRLTRISRWGGSTYGRNVETVVERTAFDRHLRGAAVAAGAELVTATAQPRPGGAVLAGGTEIAGRMVFDARGRKALGRRPNAARGPATIAIAAALRLAPGTAQAAHVLPLDDGWLWLASLGDGRGWVQLTQDAADPAGRDPLARLAAALAGARDHLPEVTGIDGAALVRDSSVVLPVPATALEVIAIGDAVAGMDPLSGHGMFFATSSALAATAVRRTLEAGDDRESRDLALRFLNQRLDLLYLRQARLGRDFIRSEAARADLPFWSRRAAFPDDLPMEAAATGDRIARRIVVEDGRLTEAEVLIPPHAPGGVAWVEGQPAAAVWRAMEAGAGRDELAGRFGRAGEIVAAWFAGAAPEAAPARG